MKYVVVRSEDRMEVMVAFSPILSHRDVVDAFRASPRTMHLRPVSAGYLKVDGEAVCVGRSVSLGMGSRPEHDARVFSISVLASERIVEDRDKSAGAR